MTSNDRQDSSELESFRQKWLSDLRSRRESIGSSSHPQAEAASSSASTTSTAVVTTAAAPAVASSRPRKHTGPASPTLTKKNLAVVEDDEYYLHGLSFDAPPPPPSASGQLLSDAPGEHVEKPLVSALDHYEEAMEKEAQGNMGESLRLYRKAYRVSLLLQR